MESADLSRMIVEDFLRSSWRCIEALVKELSAFKPEPSRKTSFFYFKNGQKADIELNGKSFFLRASVEYSNPQLTLEDVQGVVATRLLEACGNYFNECGLHEPEKRDIEEICELLKSPSKGPIQPFLLNTDDIEPDRYSMNPLKQSIINSDQSAFSAWAVRKERLEIDENFAQKYEGSLFCRSEIERIAHYLRSCATYMDMIDAVKYEHLENLSEAFGINLFLPSLRMPLSILERETLEGLLHYIIREVHASYETIERVYTCMGRSMKKLSTLLTIPHSEKGYGSKRAARGRIYLEETRLKSVKVNYKTTLLYPNGIDAADVSIAKAEDSFVIEGERFVNYNFRETPSSPQFVLYSLASPEDAVLWHGIGAFGASELLKSYATVRWTCANGGILTNLTDRYSVIPKIPTQFNLIPKFMWCHPSYRNIDASIGCINNLKDLAIQGMRIEHLPGEQYIRKRSI